MAFAVFRSMKIKHTHYLHMAIQLMAGCFQFHCETGFLETYVSIGASRIKNADAFLWLLKMILLSAFS